MPSPLIHWELMVADVERAKAFYGPLLGWTFTAQGPEYTLIDCGVEPGGGLMQRPPGVTMSSLNAYFRVPDLDQSVPRPSQPRTIPRRPPPALRVSVTEVPGPRPRMCITMWSAIERVEVDVSARTIARAPGFRSTL